MAVVNFYLRQKDRNGNANIHLFLSYGAKNQFTYSTGETVNPDHWIKKKPGRSEQGLKYPMGKAINYELDRIQSAALNAARNLKGNANNRTLKIELKRLLYGDDKGKSEGDLISLFDLRDTKSFNTIKAHLKEFAKSFGPLSLDRIDYEFERKYLEYLRDESFSINYIGRHIKLIKTVMNGAIKDGYAVPMFFKDFKVLDEEVYNVFLDLDELEILYKYKFTNKEKHLERARDRFLVGCYTGLRFNDFARFDPNIHLIDKNKIRIVTGNKEGNKSKPLVIPVHPVVKAILVKYNNNLPPATSNQKLNENLTTICEKAGLKQMVTKWQTKGGERKTTTTEKYNLITSHTARRSFATNAFVAGIPEKLIMDITGHTTTAAFHKYIKISKEQSADLLLEHSFFK